MERQKAARATGTEGEREPQLVPWPLLAFQRPQKVDPSSRNGSPIHSAPLPLSLPLLHKGPGDGLVLESHVFANDILICFGGHRVNHML